MSINQPAYMILTWGCQMNEDDSQQMANLLEQMGYRQASDESDADIILLNSCSVRAKPEHKVMSKLGELRLLKEEKPGLIIGVCGCMAQREGEKLLKQAPFVDLLMGTAAIHELPQLIEQVQQGHRRVVALDLPKRNGRSSGISHTSRAIGHVGLKMFVPVMYGCNNFCAYCVVPFARGPERSRSVEEVVSEINGLVSKGCREVTLVGQNVNSYQGAASRQQSAVSKSHTDFAGLLEELNDIPGLERIRFITSHPKDLSDELIEAIAELPKVCERLHLPLQSGDDDILRRMGRGYTVEHYMALVDKLRERIPSIALTTDVMVGFPGETDEQFRNTLDTVQAIRYDSAFMFAFNLRPGTAAAEMDNQLDNPTKTRRLIELIAVQNDITLERNQEQIGKVLEVLAEGPSEKDSAKTTGYTRTNKTINFPTKDDLAGKIVKVRAEIAHPWGFTGELIKT